MLVNVETDRTFQSYLDRMEQRLYAEMQPILTAGIRLQVNRSSIAGENYVISRGGPVLLRHYQRIYRDQYRAVSEAEAKAETMTRFLAAQLNHLVTEAGRQIRRIAESLRTEIADRILAMVQAGKSNNAIARELRRTAPEISKTRAATIARTETHNSALAAIDATLESKNINVRTKTWWSAQDARVRDSHAEAHGQEVPFDQPFEVGSTLMMRPGDSSLGAGPEEIINCRCAVLFNTAPRPARDAPAPAPPIDLAARNAAAAQQAKAFVLERGRATGLEHLRWIDRRTGELHAEIGVGTKTSVSWTPELAAVMGDVARNLEIHHNHPRDLSFSGADLGTMVNTGIRGVWAHGHLGSSFYAAGASDNAQRTLNFLHERGYLTSEANNWLGRGTANNTISSAMANRVYTHAASSALYQEGFIGTYEAELAPDLKAFISDNRDKFGELVGAMRRMARELKAAPTGRGPPPALIDPPGPYAPLSEWLAYRASLNRLKLPGLAPYKAQADRHIKRLRAARR